MKALKLGALVALLAACGPALTRPAPPPSPAASQAHLKYAVMAVAGRPAWCGPPVEIAGEDQRAADEYYAQLKADAGSYSEIQRHVTVAPNDNDPQYRLAVYLQWEVLQHLPLQPSPDGYAFDYQTNDARVAGTVDAFSHVRITSRRAQPLGPCPVCLPGAALIATPAGEIQVAALRPGDLVWTETPGGERVAARLLRTGSVHFDRPHEAVRLQLADGRALTASPGHPTADGRTLGALRRGDRIDGSVVSSVERLQVEGDTYDILPSGPSAAYWADGILVGSTLQN